MKQWKDNPPIHIMVAARWGVYKAVAERKAEEASAKARGDKSNGGEDVGNLFKLLPTDPMKVPRGDPNIGTSHLRKE